MEAGPSITAEMAMMGELVQIMPPATVMLRGDGIVEIRGLDIGSPALRTQIAAIKRALDLFAGEPTVPTFEQQVGEPRSGAKKSMSSDLPTCVTPEMQDARVMALFRAAMPFRDEDIAYLRRKAVQLRRLAQAQTPISAKLLEIAAELEAQADQIGRHAEPPKTP